MKRHSETIYRHTSSLFSVSPKNRRFSSEYLDITVSMTQGIHTKITVTMAQDRTGTAEVEEDRLSSLPSNVIDHILELLPIKDAARSSILSKKWRSTWAMLPYLVLDELFCKKLTEKSQTVFKKTVNEILLHHLGNVVKFVLDARGVNLSSYADIDGWVRYVTEHGVKELTLHMSKNTTYKLPSYIFNCSTLTILKLCNCVFKPPNSFLGFQNLVELNLERITFVPTTGFVVINVPLLVKLVVFYCDGTQYLNINISSKLEYLSVRESQYDLDLNSFMNCYYLTELHLVYEKLNEKRDDVRSTLEKLLFNLSALKVLTLGTLVQELLSADAVTKVLPFTLSCLCRLRLGAFFDNVGQTSYVVELIKSSPNLSELEIWVNLTNDSAEAAMEYLDSPTCLDQPLNKLKYVTIHLFKGSKAEMLFIKLLCARTPSLLRMTIRNHSKVSGYSREEMNNITSELLSFCRASPMAKLSYSPNSN